MIPWSSPPNVCAVTFIISFEWYPFIFRIGFLSWFVLAPHDNQLALWFSHKKLLFAAIVYWGVTDFIPRFPVHLSPRVRFAMHSQAWNNCIFKSIFVLSTTCFWRFSFRKILLKHALHACIQLSFNLLMHHFMCMYFYLYLPVHFTVTAGVSVSAHAAVTLHVSIPVSVPVFAPVPVHIHPSLPVTLN